MYRNQTLISVPDVNFCIIVCLTKGLVAVSGVSLISKWAPIYERSIFLTVGVSGMCSAPHISRTHALIFILAWES